MSQLAAALGLPQPLTFKGKSYNIEQLDLNDAAAFETATGIPFWEADVNKIEFQRTFLWLLLAKADPDLTDVQRETGVYRLTERQVGKMFPLKDYIKPETIAFVLAVLTLGGVMPEDEAAEDSPNAEGATSPNS